MNTSAVRLLLIAVFFGLLAACAAPTRIATNKAANYTNEPKRIFVLTDIGTEFGKDFSSAFQSKMIAIAKECGAAIQIDFLSALQLDESIYDKRMKAFNPDSFLSIRRTGGTKSQYGVIINVSYDARLIDMPSNKAVWRANMNFVRGSTSIAERGETLAVDLTNKMKEDQIFRTCPIVKAKT